MRCLADLFILTPTRPIIVMQQLCATTKSLTFPPLSIDRYAFIQLSQLGRQWRERKCPILETVPKGESPPPPIPNPTLLTIPLHISSFWSTLFTLSRWYAKSRASKRRCCPRSTIREQPAQLRPSPNSCLQQQSKTRVGQ